MLRAWLDRCVIFWGVKSDSLEVSGDFDFINVSFNIKNSIYFLLRELVHNLVHKLGFRKDTDF